MILTSFIWERVSIKKVTSFKDKYFTLIGFIILIGKPVICVLILASINENQIVKTGDNFRQELNGNFEDADFFEKN